MDPQSPSPDVVFAALPFADIQRPVIGISLLQAGLRNRGFKSRIEYFNITLAESIGLETYQLLANSLPPECLVGEWFFADLVFGDRIPDAEDYLKRVLHPYVPSEAARSAILEARTYRARFIDSCVARLTQLQPRVVGFPTSFHQTCACLAVARRLKAEPNAPWIVFGGANCEGEMGWQMIRSFPWIDYVATSEADLSFPRLIENLLIRNERGAPPGILGRDDETNNAEPVSDLDGLPIPDYSEYFARARSSLLGSALKPVALIETSRGCWWGAKHHCTFCGLNGATMTFRSKSVERCVQEFTLVSEQNQVKRIDCVDNILDTRYIKSLFPTLAGGNLGLSLFYEVKANLGYDQLQLMQAGGVHGIQPGIESFSNHVLRIMRKGCTGFQNIQLLRWCRELEIDVVWNILAGFPGESPQEYEQQADLIPLLTHLAPPSCCTSVRLDRFSPFYSSPGEFGFGRVRPAAAYYYVFPLERRELSKLAYFFDFDYQDRRDPDSYLKRLREEVGRWWSAQLMCDSEKPRLDAKPDPRGLLIEDTRQIAVKERHVLSGVPAQLYLSCDTARNPGSLTRSQSFPIEESEVRALLEGFVEAKTMVRMDDHYLSLAVFRERSRLMEVNRSSESTHVRQAATPEPLLRVV